MAPVAFSPLLAEFPEFNPDEAPGAEELDEGALDTETPQHLVKEEQHASHDYKGSATGKPESLEDAFEFFDFPAEYHDPFLNLVGTSSAAPAEVIASLPFGSYREEVVQVLQGSCTPLLCPSSSWSFFVYFGVVV